MIPDERGKSRMSAGARNRARSGCTGIAALHGKWLLRVHGKQSVRIYEFQEIGIILGMTAETVKTQLKKIFSRLQVENRATAASLVSEFLFRA
jgi:hypothetical protein